MAEATDKRVWLRCKRADSTWHVTEEHASELLKWYRDEYEIVDAPMHGSPPITAPAPTSEDTDEPTDEPTEKPAAASAKPTQPTRKRKES